jgi:membrane protease subunit (stomatin/prohibitin family)
MAMQQTLALRFAQHAPELAEIGCRIITVGQFQVNISDADRARLAEAQAEIGAAKRAARVANIGIAQAAAEAQQRQIELDQRFNQDSRYVTELAGNYANYASGQALIGAGQGLAKGAGDGAVGAGASLGVGFALANQLAHGLAGGLPAGTQPASGSPAGARSAAPARVVCPSCKQQVASGKFCSECAAPLVPSPRVCSACGTEGSPTARFCAGCGTAFPDRT